MPTNEEVDVGRSTHERFALFEELEDGSRSDRFAVVEGVMKAMGLKTLAAEIGILGMGGAIELHTNSGAAKSFVSRRLAQQAILNSEVVVRKISGTRDPADVLTKYLPCDSATRTLRER